MKRALAIFCTIALLTTGCATQNASSKSASPMIPASQSGSTGTELYGKVTQINGNEITVALGTLNAGAGGRPGSANSNGGTGKSSSKPNGKDPSGSTPAKSDEKAASGTPPQGGGMREALTLTGEKKVITISDKSVISAQNMSGTSSSTVSAIKVDSELKITMDGGIVSAIEIMQFWGGKRNTTNRPASSSSK